ncbi:MAG: putative lipoprotein [Gammaproteobacteria bacterium]|nr:putative lipoprotein [Gammaproteobacteria bacterium]
MYYKKILMLSASVIILAGCATTETAQLSPKPAAIKHGDIKHVAPDTSNNLAVYPSTDVSASYSTVNGDVMTQTSISAPLQETTSEVSVTPVTQQPAPVPTSTVTTTASSATAVSMAGTVPRIPTASEAARAAAAKTPSYANGFSVNMAYKDAWPKVRKALPAAGYAVMEKDETTGTYYVLDKIGSGGKIERDTPIYQVRLTKAGDAATKVILLDSANKPAAASVSNRILGALKNKL